MAYSSDDSESTAAAVVAVLLGLMGAFVVTVGYWSLRVFAVFGGMPLRPDEALPNEVGVIAGAVALGAAVLGLVLAGGLGGGRPRHGSDPPPRPQLTARQHARAHLTALVAGTTVAAVVGAFSPAWAALALGAVIWAVVRPARRATMVAEAPVQQEGNP